MNTEKGYIDKSDLSEVFGILGESVGEDEVNSKSPLPLSHKLLVYDVFLTYLFVAMIKIAGVKSNDKINFKEFCDFFYKLD